MSCFFSGKRMRPVCSAVLIALAFAAPAIAPAAESPKSPPAPPVQFSKDVLPIFAHRCFECHANGKRKGDLDMSTRESLLKGGKDGPAIVVGNSAKSALIDRVTSTDEDERMPAKGDPLTKDEIATLRAWIDQGAPWDAAVAQLPDKPRVKPRPVALPPGEGNPIDRLLAPYLAQHHAKATEQVDDRRFARRAYFDIIGLPPTPVEFESFASDTSPDKREKLAETLLARNQDYAEHWMSFWCDHLRSGTTFGIDGKNININGWLLPALRDNLPYDQFVRTLINPGKDGPRGFIDGLKMRGVVVTSARTEIQAAQNISQVFLGTQIKCATCHDSFTSRWTQAELWGMATIFADGPMEIARCEVPTGKIAKPAFLFPELGTIDPALPKPQQIARLADLVTRRDDGLLARTIVNRLWARLIGRGLVEPVDNMENPPWHPDLLDWLANDFVEHGYDLKHTIELIVTSRAHAMPAGDDAELGGGGSSSSSSKYVFTGPRFRRLSAEQYADAVCQIGDAKWAALTAAPPKPTAAKPDPKNEIKLGRAWTHTRSALQEALGRPDRNNVTTVREQDASTLQALQILTGPELNGVVDKLAAKLVKDSSSADALIELIWFRAFNRAPTKDESKLAAEVLGDKPTPRTAGDLLWLVIATPEFQVID
jgi:mono/diheme cytochrome c family protein